MKRFLLAVLLIATTAMLADDLVEAAKAAKAKRKKSTTKVITNADVKKAKATLVETKPKEIPVTAAVPEESSLQKRDRERKERIASDLQITAAGRTVAELEKELAMLEQKYYEENDLDRRDKELVRRFNDVKAKRDAAKKELEALEPPVVKDQDRESRPSP